MKRLGDTVLLFHGTTTEFLPKILESNALIPRDLCPDDDNFNYGGSGKWVYMAPVRLHQLRKPLPEETLIDEFVHHTIPEHDAFSISLLLCPSLLEKEDWYISPEWNYGGKDIFHRSWKHLREGSRPEILYPNKIEFEPYLIAIVALTKSTYLEAWEIIPPRLQNKLILERDMGSIFDTIFELEYTSREKRYIRRVKKMGGSVRDKEKLWWRKN